MMLKAQVQDWVTSSEGGISRGGTHKNKGSSVNPRNGEEVRGPPLFPLVMP